MDSSKIGVETASASFPMAEGGLFVHIYAVLTPKCAEIVLSEQGSEVESKVISVISIAAEHAIEKERDLGHKDRIIGSTVSGLAPRLQIVKSEERP
jgi:hypothetical protein